MQRLRAIENGKRRARQRQSLKSARAFFRNPQPINRRRGTPGTLGAEGGYTFSRSPTKLRTTSVIDRRNALLQLDRGALGGALSQPPRAHQDLSVSETDFTSLNLAPIPDKIELDVYTTINAVLRRRYQNIHRDVMDQLDDLSERLSLDPEMFKEPPVILSGPVGAGKSAVLRMVECCDRKVSDDCVLHQYRRPTSSSADYVGNAPQAFLFNRGWSSDGSSNANAILKGQLAAGMVEMTDDELNKRSSQQKEIIEEMQSYRDGRNSTLQI